MEFAYPKINSGCRASLAWHNGDMRTLIHRLLPVLLLLAACGDDEVSSDEEARRAYLGLDTSVGKALTLGMLGFNAATSANIPDQMTTGDVEGTMVVSGQVDQGASTNKEMRLLIAMTGYSDGPAVQVDGEDIDITYTTTDPLVLPALDLSLRDIPNGTFTGTLVGAFSMTGDLEGTVNLNLMLSGMIEDDGAGGIRRVVGSTHVTGTASSGDGTYQVDVTL